MTHAITGRVARTSLSLVLCLPWAAPILSAEEPRPGCAWSPPREETHSCGTDFDLGCCRHDRARGCPGPVPFGPITLPAATADAPPPALPLTLLEMVDARLKAPPATDAESLALEGYVRANVLPQLAALQWSHQDVWSNGAPLLLLDWSAGAAGPGNALRPDGVKRVADAKADGDWAALSSKVALRERDDRLDPSIRNTWETDESLRMPLGGSLFVFGQLGASSPSVEQQQLKWLGKTGVGVKLKPWLLQEVQVRGGPAVRYDDTSLTRGQSPERSELFLEAVTKLPLPVVGPLNVEYTSYAVPAATPSDHNQINQDFKLAVPLSSGGQFHVGAKYKWENAAAATPWVERMEIYMGVQLKH